MSTTIQDFVVATGTTVFREYRYVFTMKGKRYINAKIIEYFEIITEI